MVARSARFEPEQPRIRRHLLLKSIDVDHQMRPFGRALVEVKNMGVPVVFLWVSPLLDDYRCCLDCNMMTKV